VGSSRPISPEEVQARRGRRDVPGHALCLAVHWNSRILKKKDRAPGKLFAAGVVANKARTSHGVQY
jgi:hypothetical protein